MNLLPSVIEEGKRENGARRMSIVGWPSLTV